MHGSHLITERCEIVAETFEFGGSGGLEVPRHHMSHWQREHVIKRANPVFHVALVHGGTGIGQEEIACSDGLLIREVDHKVAPGMRRAGLIDQNFMASHVEPSLSMYYKIQ